MDSVIEMIKEGNRGRTKWAIYAKNSKCGHSGCVYLGTIEDSREPEIIARQICKGAKRKTFEIKIGSIILC